LRLLSVRDHSRSELHAKLQRRGFSAEAIDPLLQRAAELGYLDEARFALSRARSLVRQGKAVGARLTQELQRHGLAPETADEAMEAVAEEFPTEDVLRDLLARRFSQFSYHRADDRERGRVIRFFQRRGFPLALVLSILKEER